MLVPPNIHKYRDSSDCINRQTKSPTQLLTNTKKINEQIEGVKSRYRYNQDDFIKIIHIVDMDGVYIPDTDIIEANVEEIQYFEDHIDSKCANIIVERNRRKGDIRI